jgi:2,5-diketo-D-gluconate reductase A
MTSPSAALPGGGAMPLLGFGTWQATGRRAYDAVRVALETGYRHIDTATMYGNEAEVGRALRDSGVDRADVFITTKLPPQRVGRERETIAASLEALGTDHLDLWLIHWPPRGRSVPVWREFVAARDGGLTRAIGVSNYSPRQIDELVKETGETPAVNQIEWGPSLYDERLAAEHRDRGVVLEGYSPFKTTNLRDKTLVAIAEAHGVTVPQVIVRWHLQHEFVVIPKSVTPDRIRTNFDAFGFELSDDEMRRIDGLSR